MTRGADIQTIGREHVEVSFGDRQTVSRFPGFFINGS